MKFFFFYIMNSVRERAFFTFFCKLLNLVFKILKNKNLYIDQKYLKEQIEIFHKRMHTYLKNK